MPVDYNKYPKNWKTEIVPQVKKRDNNCCAFCGLKNYSVGYRNKEGHFYTTEFVIEELESTGLDMFEDELFHCVQKDGKVKPIKIVLTIAHLNHNINDNSLENLKALCKKCHLNYDKEHHKKNSRETLNKKKKLQSLF